MLDYRARLPTSRLSCYLLHTVYRKEAAARTEGHIIIIQIYNTYLQQFVEIYYRVLLELYKYYIIELI